MAPFATQIFALDESTMDAVHRWLLELRSLPVGDSRLLAGRLVGLFDIRRQQWVRLDWLPVAVANCLEALIFLGAYRSDRSAYLLRLVRVRYRGQWYSYITSSTDPLQLSGAEIVALYARRWDIELGFRLLKDHLGLRLLWSAKVQVIGAQIWATVLLAQLLHALRVQVAVEAGVETFDVSLELLWRYLPEMAQRAAAQDQALLEVIGEVGVAIKLIRPSTRIHRRVAIIEWHEIIAPPVDLLWMRPPRYTHKAHAPGTGSHSHARPKTEPGVI